MIEKKIETIANTIETKVDAKEKLLNASLSFFSQSVTINMIITMKIIIK